MAHTWTVSAMDYNVSQDGHTNVVTTVHWRCSKEDGDNSGSSYGTVGLEAPSGTFDSAQKFRGKYGPIKFYNRVLSSSEISQNFNSLRIRYGI